jgi:hypothetical protein
MSSTGITDPLTTKQHDDNRENQRDIKDEDTLATGLLIIAIEQFEGGVTYQNRFHTTHYTLFVLWTLLTTVQNTY